MRKVLHFRSLQELRAASPSFEQLMAFKWVGMKTVRELARVVPRLAEQLASREAERLGRGGGPHPRRAGSGPPLPLETSRVTEFFDEIIAAGLRAPPGEARSAEVACMVGPRSRWCLGVVQVRRIEERRAVAWSCPRCGKSGEIDGVGGGRYH